jgi:signal transduction histidine kinase
LDRGIEITRHTLEEQGLTIDYRIRGEIESAYLDEQAITLAVVNLIDNATKYATGTSFVGVEVSEKDQVLSVDVFDQGVGIPKGHIRRVFERFYRVPSAETRRQRGSGIGLSLVRHIAEGHGGKVVVTSTPGIETRFSVQIPAVRTH